MAITNVKNYNTEPYFDDFDESKNYHRILFRPGFAVQARELTQLQTSLQSQIDKLGQVGFSDGDRVVEGKLSLNVDYNFVKLENTDPDTSNALDLADFAAGKTLIGETSGVHAEILQVEAETGSDPITLYVKYINSGTDTTTKTFSDDEVVKAETDGVFNKARVGGGASSTIAAPITGTGSAASISEGVYFISGSFVHVPKETLLLDKYSNTPSYIIGLSITETDVSSGDAGHEDLVDNATGTSNRSAPGANRYTITTELIKEDVSLANRTVDNYIHLMSIKDGIIYKRDENSKDTELNSILETRTREESGDYVISEFTLDIKEHLNENNNNGYLTSTQGGDSDKIAIGIEPSTAYIDGRRVEKITTEHVILDKPRTATDDEFTIPSVIQSMGFGNYIKIDYSTADGIPDINNATTLNLKDVGTNNIGTCRVRGLEYDSAESVFRLYIFDVNMDTNKFFSEVTRVTKIGGGVAFAGNLATGAVGKRYDAGNNSLVYPLPARAISTLKDGTNYTANYNQRYRATGTIQSNSISISGLPHPLASDDDIILWDGTTLIEVSDSNVVSGSVGSTTININHTGTDATAVVVLLTLAVIGSTSTQAKQKIKSTNQTQQFTFKSGSSPGTGELVAGQSFLLEDVDILSITSIEDTTDPGGVDYKDLFTLDDGQREAFYDRGSIKLKPGQTLVVDNVYKITYDCFKHESQGEYFSVDSYDSADYDIIPKFNGIELRDAIDFRSTKSRTTTTVGAEFSTGDRAIAAQPVEPVGILTVDIKHWLPRTDKLFLTKSGEYKVVKGAASLFPLEPENIKDAIHLYTISLNPYVFGVQDVIVRPIDNKRYTMRDIGSLEKRINNLEYYTSLSLLEKSASESQILDTNGDTRFKNGFIVDGFYGHNIGDSAHTDYSVSMDRENGILRPKFDERNINLVRPAADTGTAQKSSSGGIITMPYTETVEIDQPYSSYAEFVNPYNVVVWDGKLRLSPESDEWKDTDSRPDIIINDSSSYDQFVTMAEEDGILGTVWNEWETNWTGKTRTTTSSAIHTVGRAEAERRTGTIAPGTGGTSIADISRNIVAITETGTETRSGIHTYVTSDTQTREVGDALIETNFIPFMRSRKVYFTAELMKPNTEVYPFFNGVDISDYCKTESSFEEFSDETSVITYEGNTAHPDGQGTLTTDATGKLVGSFIIPSNEALKFKTGTREFKLTDSSDNVDNDSTTLAKENFFAQGILEVYQKTIINTKVPRLASSEVTSQTRSITRDLGSEVTYDLIRYYDPIAETFIPSTEGGIFTTSIDLYLAAIDSNLPLRVSIREVENGYPTQRIIPGADAVIYPQEIATQAGTTINAFSNPNASIKTTVNWDFPIYLKPGAEYAIVLLTNSDKYRAYVAEMGKDDLTNTAERINKQPYNGVFFTSANASTWSADQNKDLKFTLNRASFTGTSAEFNLVNDTVPSKLLNSNPLKFKAHPSGTTCEIVVYHPNHGMYGADGSHKVTISGVTGTVNGIPNTNINGDHVVKSAALDSYSIIVTGQATTLNITGGGNNIIATENQMYDLLRLNTSSIEFNNAKIDYYLDDMTGNSVNPDGGQESYTFPNTSPFPERKILGNNNIYFEQPRMITSDINQTYRGTGRKSVNLRCVLSNNGIENLSPVIDLNRTSLFTIQNRINYPDGNEDNYKDDTETTGVTSAANYITKHVDLDTAADGIDIYLNANKPKNSDIEVYYKVFDDADSDFDSIDWTLINPVNIIPTDSGGGYSEVHYSQQGFTAEFIRFSIKIVLKSKRSTDIPTIRDFRAIATI